MKLGELVEHDNQYLGRCDAFHVACVLCEVGEGEDYHGDVYALAPGSPVRFKTAAYSEVRPCRVGEAPHGIIDPFIKEVPTVYGDKLVWVILVPGLAGAPRHDFDINIKDVDDKSTWDCRGCE